MKEGVKETIYIYIYIFFKFCLGQSYVLLIANFLDHNLFAITLM